jgi:hypothetical protein
MEKVVKPFGLRWYNRVYKQETYYNRRQPKYKNRMIITLKTLQIKAKEDVL